jgi:hypothetical protein
MQELYLINKSAVTFDIDLDRRVTADPVGAGNALTAKWIDAAGTKTTAINAWNQAATTLSAGSTANGNQLTLTAITGLKEDQLLSVWDSYHSETTVIKSIDSATKIVTLYNRLQHAYATGTAVANTSLKVTPISNFADLQKWTLEINDGVDLYAVLILPVYYYYNPPIQPVDLQRENQVLFNHWNGNISIRRKIQDCYFNEVIPMFRHFFVKGVPVHPSLLKKITILLLQKNFALDQMTISGDGKWIEIKDALLAETNKMFDLISQEIQADDDATGENEDPENFSLITARRFRG